MRELTDIDLAYHLAVGIGDISRATRAGGLLSGRTLARTGNRTAQSWVETCLQELRPHDAVLAENAVDDCTRLEQSRVWIVDVIDGTKEFSTGRTDWAVHVCLVADGRPIAAAVGMPDVKRVWRSDSVQFVDGPRSGCLVVSRNRPPHFAEQIAAKTGCELRHMGSAGAKMMSVLLGDADAYIHSGGQHEWDSAAPVGVALAAGLHCSRLDGSPLTYNRSDAYLPDLIICRPEMAEHFLDAAKEFI